VADGVLQPKGPAKIDEVIVVEIKRGADSKGKEHRATDEEVQKFHGYILAVDKYYKINTLRPRVRGIMIVQEFTTRANDLCRSLEQIREPQLEFKTWQRVIKESEDMHVGWLKVSERRSKKILV
jgi:RecB family endonuclease NucS